MEIKNIKKYEDAPEMYDAANLFATESVPGLNSHIDHYREDLKNAKSQSEKISVLNLFEGFIGSLMEGCLINRANDARNGSVEMSDERWELLPDEVLSAWASEFASDWMIGEDEDE